MLQSSAYRTNRWPRRSSSRSSSSSTRFESNGESGPPCGVPSRLSSNNPPSSTPAVRYPRISRRPRRSETRAATAAISRSWLTRSKNLARSNVHDEPIAFDDAGLCLRHRLVSGAARPKAEAVLAECRVPLRLQPLQDRLLDHAIDHGWNAEAARSAGRLRDSHPTHRLRLIAPLEQLIFDFGPARFEDARQLFDGHAVDAGRPLVAHHCTQRRFYIVRVTDRLHQMLCGCRAFGFGRRRDRFDLLHVRARSFTPARHQQGQLELVWRSRFGHETPDLLALSFNPLSGTVRAFGQRASLLRPLLTSAPRSGRLTTSSVPKDTVQISRS